MLWKPQRRKLVDAIYANGVKAAMDDFGVREAHDLQRRMPDGPGHLGAERLTKMLGAMDEDYKPNTASNKHRIDQTKPIRWGPQQPIDVSSGGPGAMGMSSFNGV